MFLFLLRLCFGAWLLYVGVYKWVAYGPSGFSGAIAGQFTETWVPGALTVLLAWVIIIAEPVLGLWLLIGKHVKLAWLATSLLMFQLMIGQTILGEHAGVINNWHYLIAALFAAAYSPSCCATSCKDSSGDACSTEQKTGCCG
jgi:uncharacterized membrane protein YphA (DoxX/SURF4 family)